MHRQSVCVGVCVCVRCESVFEIVCVCVRQTFMDVCVKCVCFSGDAVRQ